MKVTETTDNADINGIGGVAKGRVVELNLESRTGVKTIVIKATVVDEIMNLQKKHENRFSQLTKESADALKKKKGFEKVTKENFQQLIALFLAAMSSSSKTMSLSLSVRPLVRAFVRVLFLVYLFISSIDQVC